MWQTCPICKGSGKSSEKVYPKPDCPTCEGQRIISELTGKPPANDYSIIREVQQINKTKES